MNARIVKIPLAGGLVAICDHCDAKLISMHAWSVVTDNRVAYAQTNIRVNGKKRTVRMHRLVLPNAQCVDHINHDGLDNRRCNLRAVDRFQNQFNSRPRRNCTSQYKGVSVFKSRYRVCISRNNGGFFWSKIVSDEVSAARLYDVVASSVFGEFAYLNFPESLEDSKSQWSSVSSLFQQS